MALIDKAIFALINGKKTINEPIFVKEFERENQHLNDLIELSKKVTTDNKDSIERDISFLKQGIDGEQNVSFELKNSFISMLILHDIRLEFNDYVAQMDFILITHKFIMVLETKKLSGDIEINADGDFIRYFKNNYGKVIRKEGIYSPISQNTRHVTILKEMLIKNGQIRTIPVKSAVIIANPKTIINKTRCPKSIQSQLFKYDQLTVLLKKELDKYKEEFPIKEKQMYDIAEFLVSNNKPITFDYMAKYSLTDKDFIDNKQSIITNPQVREDNPIIELQNQTSTILPQIKTKVETPTSIEDTAAYKALKEYRLKTSREENIKPYFIYNNAEMEALIKMNPKTKDDLLKCKGFGEVKVQKYGDRILEIILTNQ